MFLKGKYHANLLSFQNPKMFVCQQKQQYKLSSAIKLSISASGQTRSRPVLMDGNLKNIRLMFFKSSHFCFQNVPEQITSCSFQELS